MALLLIGLDTPTEGRVLSRRCGCATGACASALVTGRAQGLRPFATTPSWLNGPRPEHSAACRTHSGALHNLPPVRLPAARGRDAGIHLLASRRPPSDDGRAGAPRNGRPERHSNPGNREAQTGGAPRHRNPLVAVAPAGVPQSRARRLEAIAILFSSGRRLLVSYI